MESDVLENPSNNYAQSDEVETVFNTYQDLMKFWDLNVSDDMYTNILAMEEKSGELFDMNIIPSDDGKCLEFELDAQYHEIRERLEFPIKGSQLEWMINKVNSDYLFWMI